ncbi:unnamed protein product [Ectocarpus sp. 12 AP-2014]
MMSNSTCRSCRAWRGGRRAAVARPLSELFPMRSPLFAGANGSSMKSLRSFLSSGYRGLDNAGKTTIVKKFNGDDINAIEPTLGFNIKTMEYKGYQLNVWDVGGQQTIRSYWRNYFEQTDGLIWVVDSADRGRLQDCKRELHDLLGQEKLAGASLLVFANKQDLAGALGAAEIAQVLGLESKQFANRHWSIVACSAVTGEGLAQGVDWMVSDIGARIFMMS